MNTKRSVNLTGRPGGVVGTVPKVLSGSPGNREAITGRSKIIFSHQGVKTGTGVHPTLHLMGTVQTFPGIKWPLIFIPC